MVMLIWVHVGALAVFSGLLVVLWLALSPLFIPSSQDDARVRFVTSLLKIYGPVQIAVLGVVVMTGAFQLTAIKETHRVFLLQEMGPVLLNKLSLSFLIILLTTYQCLGIAHRLVKRWERSERFESATLTSAIRRLRGTSVLIAILTVLTLLVATNRGAIF